MSDTPRPRFDDLRWITGFWRPHRRLMLLIAGLTLINAGIVMCGPWIVGLLIDRLKDGRPPRLQYHLGLLLAVALAQFATYLFLQTQRAKLNLTFEWTFRQHGFEQLIRLSPRFMTRYRTGDLVTRLTDDVAMKLSWFSCSGIFRCFEAASKLLAGLVAMLLLSPQLTAVAVIPLPVVLLMFLRARKTLQSRFDRRQRAISVGSDLIQSAFAGIRVVKAYGHDGPLQDQFDTLIVERKAAEVEAVKGEVLMGALWVQTWQMAVVLVLLGGGRMVTQGTVTLGALVATMSYVGMLIWPMFDIGNFFIAAVRAMVSVGRLRELEDAVPEVRDPASPVPLPAPRGALRFCGVGVTLDDQAVLTDVDLSIAPGERVAVVGPIGAGKSVLARLVPRLIDPDAGQITLDDVPLPSLALDDLRRAVGYVPQDAILFSGTIADNIRAAREVDEQTLAWACRVSRLETDLAGFPDGTETVVGARGVTLSGGQKQRVSLARALVARPQVLVLDDCTASLDATTEAELWQALASELPGVTVMLVTHRTATLETADRVVVLEGGRVVERGNHAELIDAGGVYTSLYRRIRLEETVHER